VTLVAHSAGGWLARVYLHDFGVDDVRALVSLGSPLNACPKDVPGVVDQTRGAFYLILVPIRPRWRGERRSLRTFPGASLRPGSLAFDPDTPRRLSTPPLGILTWVERECDAPEKLGIPVTCLAGKWKMGSDTPGATIEFAVGQGYKQVCGAAEGVWGDGITPVEVRVRVRSLFSFFTPRLGFNVRSRPLSTDRSTLESPIHRQTAHLAGATCVTLDGVFHTPLGSDEKDRPWYGSPRVLDQWIDALLA
jgi:pimeloyl-ACP methyl ester carboxylesterase